MYIHIYVCRFAIVIVLALLSSKPLSFYSPAPLYLSLPLSHTHSFLPTLSSCCRARVRVYLCVCVCCVSECVELYWLVTRLGKKNRAAPAAAEPSLRLRRKQKQRTLSATIFATGVLQQVLTFNCGRLFSRAASNTTIFLFSIPRSCFLASQFCIIKNFQTNHPLNSTYYIFCLSTAKNAYIFIKFLLFFLFCVARIFTAACCRCFIVVAAGLVVIASNLFLYGCTHVHVYVFLFTKNFQPKINMQFFQLLHNYRQSTFILLRFYCSASVFCCIFLRTLLQRQLWRRWRRRRRRRPKAGRQISLYYFSFVMCRFRYASYYNFYCK